MHRQTLSFMRRQAVLCLAALFHTVSAAAQDTERLYLSGHGCDDMVEWDFRCSQDRHGNAAASDSWTKIGVPSCWELQGFGTYQYGMRFYGKASPEGIADEKGFYRTEFTLPAAWEGRQIELVFEAVFTDARVTINGRKAGAGLYQGGFTRHTIDVSDRVYFGARKNRLEVEVSKESANAQVNLAERRADYWNFGGIWRPVFIVAKPWQNISRVAIDARMDGRFRADVFLARALPGSSVCIDLVDTNGTKVATSPAVTTASDHATIDFAAPSTRIKPWTAETPHLYTAVITLMDSEGKTLHRERQRFGFRTIEYRHSYPRPTGSQAEMGCHLYGCDDDGLFINGQKVIVKGVNRHSFRPESGRTLSKAKNIEDVRLIKSMNMNAVRLSHYPADPEFLDACDSLGLYVECELPGWHWAHETVVGTQLVEEMVTRDVNHPSIIFWSNGNEGGFNYDLEPVFAKYDLQQRVVLYPWANRNGFETKHYRSWGETAEYMRQKEIFMPTEFLHGLYDGGHGAGLADYWRLMMSNPRCAGGFLWDLQDQAVLRTDIANGTTAKPSVHPSPSTTNFYDPVGNFGSDGIVGPHGEREGSYYTIKEVWSPIQLDLSSKTIRNCYAFTNLKDCRFTYQWVRMPSYDDACAESDKQNAPQRKGRETESDKRKGETVVSHGTIPSPDVAPGAVGNLARLIPPAPENAHLLRLTATDPHGDEVFTWSIPQGLQPPCLADKYENMSLRAAAKETADELTINVQASNPKPQTTFSFSKQTGQLTAVTSATGKTYSFGNGPRFIAAKRSDRSDDGFYNHDDKEAFQKKTLYTEYADQGQFAGFELTDSTLTVSYRHGSLNRVVWHFGSDGTASFTAYATFNGVVDLMGVCFDYPEAKVQRKQWVGNGPYRVWQNRMEGPQMGYYETDYNDPIPGETWQYPEFKGYFAGVQWMRLVTDEGSIAIERTLPFSGKTNYIGVYTPRDGRDKILYDLPQTGLSLLSVIPAVRNKVNTTDLNGPSAQPQFASGKHVYSATLHFE